MARSKAKKEGRVLHWKDNTRPLMEGDIVIIKDISSHLKAFSGTVKDVSNRENVEIIIHNMGSINFPEKDLFLVDPPY